MHLPEKKGRMKTLDREQTVGRVQAGDFSQSSPEFGRTKDVERHFGLKRGTLYNLHAQNRVRGHLLRIAGDKSGVRLWDMESIRTFIRSAGDFDGAGQSVAPAPLRSARSKTNQNQRGEYPHNTRKTYETQTTEA